MTPVGFEPTISAGERPQTYALDRAATGTGANLKYCPKICLAGLGGTTKNLSHVFRISEPSRERGTPAKTKQQCYLGYNTQFRTVVL